MKKIIPLLFFLSMFFTSSIAYSDSVFLGAGFYKQITAQAEYDKNARYYNITFEFDDDISDRYFPFVNFGTFNHFNERTFFATAGYSVRTKGAGLYAQGSAGFTYLDAISSRHATREQFYLAVFGGYKTPDYNVRIGWEHISNGSEFIGSPKPNDAEDMFTISIGIPFKTIW